MDFLQKERGAHELGLKTVPTLYQLWDYSFLRGRGRGGGGCWPNLWCWVQNCLKPKVGGWEGDEGCWPNLWCWVKICLKPKVGGGGLLRPNLWCWVQICLKPKVGAWGGGYGVVDPTFDVGSKSAWNSKLVAGWLLTQPLKLSPNLPKTRSSNNPPPKQPCWICNTQTNSSQA